MKLKILALFTLVLATALAGCKRQAQTPAGGGRGGGGFGQITVGTTTATNGSIGIYVHAIGTVVPLQTATISSRVQGTIVAVKYQEGQMVKAGDPLIEIDPGPSQAAVTQAEGQLKRDQALLANANLDLARYQEAYSSNAIPKQQLDTQTALVQQDEGTVKLDQGMLDNARAQLSYCHITAPISGRVGLRLVDVGNMAQANSTTALVVIAQLQPITVIFKVAEDDLPPILAELRAGKTLTVDAFNREDTNKLASGTLETLDNQIDPTSGTVNFRAIFNNEDSALFPNQFVNAHLLVRTMQDAVLLPNDVLQRNADGAFVYLLKPDPPAAPAQPDPPATNAPAPHLATVVLQPITVTTTDGEVSAVNGLEPGAVVVADNFNKLTDGAKVAIRQPRTGAGGGGGGHHQWNSSQQPGAPDTGGGTNQAGHHQKNPSTQ
jgi:multidrug efflux system membrane fusion protein